MKSTAIELSNNFGELPSLFVKKGGKFVVLAYELGLDGTFSGIVVHSSPTNPRIIGYHSDTWNMDAFVPFRGSVTISTD